MHKYENIKLMEKEKPIMITAVLSNGLVVRVPMENSSKIIEQMEKNIKEAQKRNN